MTTIKFATLSLLLTTLALPALAASATPSAAAPNFGPAAVPEEANAIALYPDAKGKSAEQWMQQGNTRSVRNVTHPTLTPVLPDPAKATGAAVIVAPGGAFFALSIDNEGYRVAQWLADRGIAAFVLKYRLEATPREPEAFAKALQERMKARALAEETNSTDEEKPLLATKEAVADAQSAIRLVRARAKEWGVDQARVGMVGFSAGAMTTIDTALGADDASRPDFIAPIYPPMMAREVPDNAPPMFLAIALDDPLFAINRNLGLIDAWRKAGKPLEVHLYERGGHGFGMVGGGDATAQWIEQFHAWMTDRGIIGELATLNAGNGLSVEKSTIGELLANPEAKAILVQHLPQIANSDRAEMMANMTLVQIRGYSPDTLTSEKLAAVQAELNKL